MKTSYLLVLILILVVGGIVWLNAGAEKAVAPTTVPANTESATKNTPTAEEHGMTPEEHTKMMQESATGTDVGMEMPETDMSNMNHEGMNMTQNTKVFNISGTNFAFDVKEIKVKKGDTVVINFTSADGFHDVVIDEFKAKTEQVKTGGVTKTTFVADKIGTFEYYCSVGKHRMNGMVGKLIVE